MRHDTLMTDAQLNGNYDALCVGIDLGRAWRDDDVLEYDEKDAIYAVLCNDVTPHEYAELNGVSVETVYKRIRDGVGKLHDDLNGYTVGGELT